MAKNPTTSSNKRRVQGGRVTEAPTASVAPKRRDRRRLWVTLVIAFLALALIAPLTAGLISNDDPVENVTTPEPVELAWVNDPFAGAELTAETPCPATDGTAERTTGFAQAPPLCIEADDSFTLELDTGAGLLEIPFDASLNHTGANLAAVFGHYGTYENTIAATSASGDLLFVGGPVPTGFELPVPTEDQGPYEVGSVVLISADSGLSGAFAVALTESGVEELAANPRHVVVGTIEDLSSLNETIASEAFGGGVLVGDSAVK